YCIQDIESVTLSSNQIGDQGAQYIAEVLKNNEKVVCLNFDWNKISEQGARYLGELLQTNTTLEILNLNLNEIGEQGGQYLAQALEHNNVACTFLLSPSSNHLLPLIDTYYLDSRFG
ncbi:unnamed protein product, partial [Rotaria magnacalcarata]